MSIKIRMKSYSFWVSLASAIFLVIKVVGQNFGFTIDETLYNDLFTALCGILVICGIVAPPTGKEIGMLPISNAEKSATTRNSTNDEQSFKQDKETETTTVKETETENSKNTETEKVIIEETEKIIATEENILNNIEPITVTEEKLDEVNILNNIEISDINNNESSNNIVIESQTENNIMLNDENFNNDSETTNNIIVDIPSPINPENQNLL